MPLNYNLTEFTKASGCGCKIEPEKLKTLLKSDLNLSPDINLLIGNQHNEDAAVYDLGNGKVLISTIDFFTPMVNDPFDFGYIAAANALSDVYAMGGSPILATAVLGWPTQIIPLELAQQVLEGGRSACDAAGIKIAGGHSIESPEPFFGLSVNGLMKTTELKTNSGAKENDLLYITKPLGVGVLSAALKKGKLSKEHETILVKQLKQLNKLGALLGKQHFINALTDVTGFGLAGHALEMAKAADLTLVLSYDNLPIINGFLDYTSQLIVPDNLYRNFNAYKDEMALNHKDAFFAMCDPQTNGGLLIAVNPEYKNDIETLLSNHNLIDFAKPIGVFEAKQQISLIVN
jgi:selenide,water dikinase